MAASDAPNPSSEARAGFPTTMWSRLLVAPGGPGGGPEERRQALTTLIERYWQPVFCAARFGWRLPIDEAKDATQAFFADLLERDVLADLDPAKGRLRAYLKAALKHFLLNRRRDAARERRGGDRLGLPLEHADRLSANEAPPDEVLDEQWVGVVLQRGVDTLRRELVASGRDATWEAFRRYDLADEDTTYAALARDLGLTEGDVRNRLHAARVRLRALVEGELADYVRDAEELGEEVRWILG